MVRHLMSDNSASIPQHIAVVMDGNGRWAKKRLLPRVAGHKSGVNATRLLVENCANHGVEVLTIFAFSSENWNRPEKEVKGIMSLFVSTLASEAEKLHKKDVRVNFIGDRSRFSESLQNAILEAEKLTCDNKGLILNIAANYGGRWDIAQACKKIAEKSVTGELSINDITEQEVASEVCLAGMPEPDLFIRTGGESRISNFLIWQLAYTELYFTDVLWPDFDEKVLGDALKWYQSRQRRFGKTSDQVVSSKQATD
jgi:undecaprenyl diphosphate synthase